MMQGRVLDDAGPSGSMQGRLDEPDRHQPGHRAQGQFPARPPRSVGLSGRLTKETPATCDEPNVTFVPQTPGDIPAASTSRGQVVAVRPHRQLTWREASDTRAESVTLQEKTLGTQQVGHGETCRVKTYYWHRIKGKRVVNTNEEELIATENMNSHIDVNCKPQKLRKKQHKKFTTWKFKQELCLKSKEAALQDSKAANAGQHLEQQVRHQFLDLYSPSHDSEISRNSQIHHLAELRDPGCAHQETIVRLSEEMEESRKVRYPNEKLREEADMDANSQFDMNNMEMKLQESQSTVNQLTHHLKELQEEVNSLKESQDFTDLQTATSSGSIHAPSKQIIFLVFLACHCASRDFP